MNPHDLNDHRHLKPARLPIPPLLHSNIYQPLRDCPVILLHPILKVNKIFYFFLFF